MRTRVGWIALCLSWAPTLAAAQGALRLDALQEAATQADPRWRELALLRAQTDLKLANIEAERLPSIAAEGHAQYQSDVPTPPALVPGGRPLFAPPKDVYDVQLRVDQPIVDATIRPRLEVERAQLLEAQARVRSALFALRQEVNDAFFAAALLQERVAAIDASIADLEARLAETNAHVREGSALPADAAAVEATLLQRRQDRDDLAARRAAALGRLSNLTGRAIGDGDVLQVPELAAQVGDARRQALTRARPEFDQYARARDRLARQQDASSARDRPRLSAFTRLGYGRPGLNFISDAFETYGVAGLQLEWKPWTWGTSGREREALDVQRQIVEADEAAFAKAIGRSSDVDLTSIDRLERAVALDDRIVALREQVARTTQLRFREGVVTASEYLDRNGDLLAAQFARAGHRVELAEARARYLTTLGLEVR